MSVCHILGLIFSPSVLETADLLSFGACFFLFRISIACSKCPNLAMEDLSNKSKFETVDALHTRVRALCQSKKIGMRHLSPAYRKVVETCLMELLHVDSLNPSQYELVNKFCRDVPGFYMKFKSSLKDIQRHHQEFFAKPLVYSVDGVDTYVEKVPPDDDLPNVE